MERSRIAKSAVVKRLDDPTTDVAYWLSRPLDERIQAVTELRHTFFEVTDEAGSRLQRVHHLFERT